MPPPGRKINRKGLERSVRKLLLWFIYCSAHTPVEAANVTSHRNVAGFIRYKGKIRPTKRYSLLLLYSKSRQSDWLHLYAVDNLLHSFFPATAFKLFTAILGPITKRPILLSLISGVTRCQICLTHRSPVCKHLTLAQPELNSLPKYYVHYSGGNNGSTV